VDTNVETPQDVAVATDSDAIDNELIGHELIGHDANKAAELANYLSFQSLIDVVDQSPKAVAIHDRDAWLAIFSSFNVVEDPVGAKPTISGLHDRKSGQRGLAPLQRFFDTFIAPNQIKFHVDEDLVLGKDVVRDLTVEIRMSDDVVVHVPMHLQYQLTFEDEQLKVRRLAAHWEIVPMVMQVLSKGFAGLKVMSLLGWRMLKIQGFGAMLGFSQAVLGVGGTGKEQAYRFIRAVNGSDERLLQSLFASNDILIDYPGAEKTFRLSDFAKKNIGHFEITKILSAGYTTSFSFSMRQGGQNTPGVGFIDFDSQTKQIQKVKLYWNS